MVVGDNERRQGRLFEIKHSGEATEAQTRHLVDEKKLQFVHKRYGDIAERTVLYCGPDADFSNGIRYCNVNAYLKYLGTER